MSHPAGLPDLFLDRSLGRLQVPDLLRAAGLRVVTLADHYGIPQDEAIPDEAWLALTGRRGWVYEVIHPVASLKAELGLDHDLHFRADVGLLYLRWLGERVAARSLPIEHLVETLADGGTEPLYHPRLRTEPIDCACERRVRRH